MAERTVVVVVRAWQVGDLFWMRLRCERVPDGARTSLMTLAAGDVDMEQLMSEPGAPFASVEELVGVLYDVLVSLTTPDTSPPTTCL